ncbi:RNA-binding protein 45 isoform X2 [Anolis carolinensis]|uniref:RNA-binding protein 45 isoform X2 n=1 Tax=Anolis carolinensis TaxID=28377 RepID=UPI002F2B6E94
MCSPREEAKSHIIQRKNLIALVSSTRSSMSNWSISSSANQKKRINASRQGNLIALGHAAALNEHNIDVFHPHGHEYVESTSQETISPQLQRSTMSPSEQLPDLSSLETSDNRSQESVSRRLSVVSEFPLQRKQLFNLFDLIPGLEACEIHQGLYSKRTYAMIQYSNVASAIFAKNRLNGYEYPFGNHLLVTFIEDETDETNLFEEMATELVNSEMLSVIWKDNSVLQLLGFSEPPIPPRIQTDAELPSSKRRAPPDSPVRESLLIIFDPHPLPPDVLDNVLSRFGNFIKVYLIPGKNMGHAMFADRASASDAIAVLHGKTVNDVKLKVTLSYLPMEKTTKP